MNLIVNGIEHSLQVPPDAPLLNVLRNDLALNGPKYGCGLGQCGACTVLVDGIAARSCVIPVVGVEGRRVTTLEGLWSLPQADMSGVDGDDGGSASAASSPSRVARLHPIQQAFVDEQAAQCGYCLNGMVMSTASLLARNPRPTEQEARDELSHNLCRCGTHIEILKAVQRAAVSMAQHRSTSGLARPAERSPASGDGSVVRIVTEQGVSGP